MGIAAAVVGAAAIGAVGTAVSGSQAAGAAKSAAAANNALEAKLYSENAANQQPFIAAGQSAQGELNGLLNIDGNTAAGTAASTTALNNYLTSAGYDFTSQQGNRAITANASVNGLLDSGGTLKALDQYNTGLASTYLGQYEGALSGVTGTGEAAAGSLAGASTAYGSQVASNNNSAASASANASLADSASLNSLLTNTIGAYGLTKGLSSFTGSSGAVGQASILPAGAGSLDMVN